MLLITLGSVLATAVCILVVYCDQKADKAARSQRVDRLLPAVVRDAQWRGCDADVLQNVQHVLEETGCII